MEKNYQKNNKSPYNLDSHEQQSRRNKLTKDIQYMESKIFEAGNEKVYIPIPDSETNKVKEKNKQLLDDTVSDVSHLMGQHLFFKLSPLKLYGGPSSN